MTGSGAISPILIILSSETPFVLRYLTKWKACLVPLSKRSKPYVIPNTNKVSKPNQCDPKNVVKYIGRYLGRPVIATSRIDHYDGESVTFHYNRHEDEKYVEETLPAIDFIKRLIRHIPEKHFKMIRYGGIYARHREIDKHLHRAVAKEKHHVFRCFNQWRTAILSSFGYDPLQCPDCRHEMEFLELYYNHQRVSLEELYEKAMSKSRGKRSSA